MAVDLYGEDGKMPGLVGSLLLLIVGAITKYAYSDDVWTWTMSGERQTLQVETVGNILLIAGLIALVLSVAYAFLARDSYIEEDHVYEDDVDVLPPRTVVVEKDHDDVLPVKKTRSRRKKIVE
jgi:hypothetical protein